MFTLRPDSRSPSVPLHSIGFNRIREWTYWATRFAKRYRPAGSVPVSVPSDSMHQERAYRIPRAMSTLRSHVVIITQFGGRWHLPCQGSRSFPAPDQAMNFVQAVQTRPMRPHLHPTSCCQGHVGRRVSMGEGWFSRFTPYRPSSETRNWQWASSIKPAIVSMTSTHHPSVTFSSTARTSLLDFSSYV